VLISKTVMVKWGTNKKWYIDKGFLFTKIGNEFEVNVEDLSDGSSVRVNIECDGCREILEGIRWIDYNKSVHKDGKYYCFECKNSHHRGRISFYEWCYNNLPKDVADKILNRWDYELNVDKNGNVLNPKDVSHSSVGINGKGYWFKCFIHPDEHGSELKNISSFTNKSKIGNIDCNRCNTISETHSHIIKYLVNKEDAYNYSHGSGKYIPMKCPDCGFEKEVRIPDLIKMGFCCPRCSDGKSYPEKFLYNVLEQLLKNNFITQLSKINFKWCKNYKYDNYINNINCIIETHGLQHYEETKHWGSLKSIQENDKQKEILARENNIENYIVIDCRKSDMNWIKTNILNSDLPKLLGFEEKDINWDRCHEIGCSSFVKVACDLWNNGTSNLVKIAELLKFSKNTIRTYLKQGAEIGWCNYDGQEAKKHREHLYENVICLTTGKIIKKLKDSALNN